MVKKVQSHNPGVSKMNPTFYVVALTWYAGWSIVSLIQFRVDKSRAQEKSWRISELTLLQTAAVGGWSGAWFGVKQFRHKSKKQNFQIRLVVATIINFALLLIAVVALNH